MHFTLDHAPIRLAEGALLHIGDGNGRTVRVVEGSVWITQQGSLDDFFLHAGDTHTFEGTGSAIVTAEGCADASATLVFDVPLSIQARSSMHSKWLQVPRRALERLGGDTTVSRR